MKENDEVLIHNEEIGKRLKDLAADVIDRCTFTTKTAYGTVRLLLPAGDNGYPAFWVRDAAMMMQTGLVEPGVMRQAVETTALYGQNGPEVLSLENGLTVPAWSVADHINHNGRPVFFPGTYADGCDQGNGRFGFFPPLDDNDFFVMMVGSLHAVTGGGEILTREFRGVPLIERLVHAWEASPTDPETGLCVTGGPCYAVDFGFHDSIRKSGKLLPSSLLHGMAAGTLSRLSAALGEPERADLYASAARKLNESIVKTFYDEKTGWFFSATGVGRQHDVWGTAAAAYLGLLDGERLKKTARTLCRGYRNGTTVYRGYIRQIPTDENFSETTMWECANTQIDFYQNGGYWATPTGFYAAVLAEYDQTAAEDLLRDFLAHTDEHRTQDAPFEWINASETLVGTRVYGTSAAGPYAAVQKPVL